MSWKFAKPVAMSLVGSNHVTIDSKHALSIHLSLDNGTLELFSVRGKVLFKAKLLLYVCFPIPYDLHGRSIMLQISRTA
jgi:hypothetical protein